VHERETGKLTGAIEAMYANVGGGGESNPSLAGIAALLMSAPDYEVWPDNMPAINLFNTISTQWRISGMGGPTGLDYNVLFNRMDRMKLSEQEYEWMFDDIRTIESAALAAINRKD
jgi:hypothetical protein